MASGQPVAGAAAKQALTWLTQQAQHGSVEVASNGVSTKHQALPRQQRTRRSGGVAPRATALRRGRKAPVPLRGVGAGCILHLRGVGASARLQQAGKQLCLSGLGLAMWPNAHCKGCL